MTKNDKNWEHLLSPEIAREKLISVSLYITAYEILKQSIIERISSFHFEGFNEDGHIVGTEYEKIVLARNKSVLYASLDWLREHDVINASDLKSFEAIKKARNLIAHNLSSFVMGDADFKHVELFQDLVAL